MGGTGPSDYVHKSLGVTRLKVKITRLYFDFRDNLPKPLHITSPDIGDGCWWAFFARENWLGGNVAYPPLILSVRPSRALVERFVISPLASVILRCIHL